ncbi:MAG TPA: hypothetical protein VF281_04070 [Candidatus Saccharimonadales bacterium]
MLNKVWMPQVYAFRILIGLFLAISASVIIGYTAFAAPGRAEGVQFANNFCNAGGDNSYGVADYMWLTALDGSNRVEAYQDDAQVKIVVHLYGRYCGSYASTDSGSTYRTSRGAINGAFNYQNNGANNVFEDTQEKWLQISGWSAGTYNICITLGTWSVNPDLNPVDSPSTCTELTLVLKQKWTIRGESYVNNTTMGSGDRQGNPAVYASPGDTLDWTHDLRNNGPGYIDKDLARTIDRMGFANGWDGQRSAPSRNVDGTPKGPLAGVLFDTVNPSAGNRTRYVVKASDAGRTMCQRIGWEPGAWNNDGRLASNYACANVPYNYDLTPGVSGPNGVTTVGAPIPTVTPTVNNSLPGSPSKTTDSMPTEWQLKRIEVAPGGSIPMTQQENGSVPCAHYGNNCIDKGSGTRVFPAGGTTLALLNDETVGPNTPVGTRICYTLSVRPYQQIAYQPANNNWRHSVPVCVTVSKQPKVQVWGGDLRTRGNIETGTTTVNDNGTNKLFGSWVEYGGFSVGSNSRFASGSGLNNGNTNIANMDAWHKLTFANTDNGISKYGGFTLPSNLPPLAEQFVNATSSGQPASDLGSLESGVYTTNAANFTVGNSTVGQTGNLGKVIVVVSTGTITIDGNIIYKGNGSSDTFNNVEQLPQVIIIAKNINITNATTQIDAWLLTTIDGSINTCSDRPLNAPLNSTVCNNLLTVNGAVATSHLHLRRTAGSEDAARAGNPAEIFNLRADTLLWSYARSSASDKAQTVYSKELPPRF